MDEDEPIDHDRIFKQLFTTFCKEFIVGFLPQTALYLDLDAPIEFLDKEVLTDLTAGETHVVDLVAKVRLRGQDAFILIHIENQASSKGNFPKRMFTYFARLHEKFDLRIYPVVVFSYDTPLRPEQDLYEVAFPDKIVLHFEYTVIQLNRLSWRDFVKQPNPVAAALMAKMKIAPRDRAKVRSECLRLLATLHLDPAKSRLIGSFIETYLKLSADELKLYDREFSKLTLAEREVTMEMMTSWHREGIQEGKEDLVVHLIRRRFGSVSSEVMLRLDQLSSEQLNELGEALLNFGSPQDLDDWMLRYRE